MIDASFAPITIRDQSGMASRAPNRSTPSRKRRFSPHRRLTGRLWWDRPHPLFFDRRIHGHSPQPLGSPCDTELTPKLGRSASLSSTSFLASLPGGEVSLPHLRIRISVGCEPGPAQWVKYASTGRNRNRLRRDAASTTFRGVRHFHFTKPFPGCPGLS
jgi:hypothetical protein